MDQALFLEFLQEQECRQDAQESQKQLQWAGLFNQLAEKVATNLGSSMDVIVARTMAVTPKLTKIAPCLMGEAQAVYRALESEEAQDYELVKKAILHRMGINPETYQLRFRKFQMECGREWLPKNSATCAIAGWNRRTKRDLGWRIEFSRKSRWKYCPSGSVRGSDGSSRRVQGGGQTSPFTQACERGYGEPEGDSPGRR